MKKTLSVFLLIIGASVMTLNYSCKKKEDDDSKKAVLDAAIQQHNADANNYKDESDAADNDVNTRISASPTLGRVAPGYSSPMVTTCMDFAVDSNISAKTFTFTFDGTTLCHYPQRTRSGVISVTLTSGAKWDDVGSVLTFTYTDFKITWPASGHWVKFNGTKTLKNINGNNWLGFITNTAKLLYQERASNVHVDFENGSQATWNVARMTEWSFNVSNYSVSLKATGDTAVNGFSNVDSWGVNRFGSGFTTYYNAAWTSNSACNWRPNSGELVHYVNSTPFTLTLGVNASGNPDPGACPPHGFKVRWTDMSGNNNSLVFPYWY